MKNEKKDYTGLFILCIIIISFALVIVGPMWIDEAFQKEATNKHFEVHWNDESALNYYGAALSFLGTAAFSALALWQNHTFKKANEKHEEMLERMEKIKYFPSFVCIYSGMSHTLTGINMEVQNISEHQAFNVIASDFVYEIDGKKYESKEKTPFGNIASKKNSNGTIEIEDIAKKKIDFSFKLYFTDSFGEEHFYKFASYKKEKEKDYFPRFIMKPVDKE